MKNFGAWCVVAFLGVLLGREFLDWVWWHNWGDEDEGNPAPFLCAIWRVWCKIKDAYFWLWSRTLGSLKLRLEKIWWRFFPPELSPEPMDQDGRTPTEWLLIEVIGVWELESWYKDEYDWEVKRRWDEFLKGREAAESPEAEELTSADPAD